VAVHYFDSSALVKRYVAETGSAWVRGLVDPATGHDIYTVTLTAPEVISAITRRLRGGQLPRALAVQGLRDFRADWQLQYQPIDPARAIIRRAMDLAENRGLRGYDAVHVATAPELHDSRRTFGLPFLIFVSADRVQLAVAAGEGLVVEDPNQHP